MIVPCRRLKRKQHSSHVCGVAEECRDALEDQPLPCRTSTLDHFHQIECSLAKLQKLCKIHKRKNGLPNGFLATGTLGASLLLGNFEDFFASLGSAETNSKSRNKTTINKLNAVSFMFVMSEKSCTDPKLTKRKNQ